jgi:hypothetical protein
LVKENIDLILGEVWYADKGGLLEKGVFRGATPTNEYSEHKMDFDDNDEVWKVYESRETEEAVSKKCAELNIPFFMRSAPAVAWVRSQRDNFLHRG